MKLGLCDSMVVENTFGRLKGWWRCLLKHLDMRVENAAVAVGACVVLHNICETFGDYCLEDWEQVASEVIYSVIIAHASSRK